MPPHSPICKVDLEISKFYNANQTIYLRQDIRKRLMNIESKNKNDVPANLPAAEPITQESPS